MLEKLRAENISVRTLLCNRYLKTLVDYEWITGFLQGAYFEGLNIGQIVADCVKSAGSSCADLEHFVQVTNAYPYELSL